MTVPCPNVKNTWCKHSRTCPIEERARVDARCNGRLGSQSCLASVVARSPDRRLQPVLRLARGGRQPAEHDVDPGRRERAPGGAPGAAGELGLRARDDRAGVGVAARGQRDVRSQQLQSRREPRVLWQAHVRPVDVLCRRDVQRLRAEGRAGMVRGGIALRLWQPGILRGHGTLHADRVGRDPDDRSRDVRRCHHGVHDADPPRGLCRDGVFPARQHRRTGHVCDKRAPHHLLCGRPTAVHVSYAAAASPPYDVAARTITPTSSRGSRTPPPPSPPSRKVARPHPPPPHRTGRPPPRGRPPPPLPRAAPATSPRSSPLSSLRS